jgi:parallel beta-helix repeat protein
MICTRAIPHWRRLFILGIAAAVALLAILIPTSPVSAASVRDFGAIGDGKADDTAAIERAVAENEDGQLEFPRGDYRITRTIEIDLAKYGRTSLNGLGAVGRVVMSGSGPAFRFVGTHTRSAAPAGFKPEVWQRERNPQIDGLEILGDHPEADGVEFIRVMQPTLRAVLIRDVRNAVTLSVNNRNLLIDSCHIYNCSGIGVFFDRVNLHQAIIHGSHISYCKRGGIKIVDGEIRNFQITGNDIEYNYDPDSDASADIWFDISNGTVAEGTIASNTIQARDSAGGANIRFIGPESSRHSTPMGLWTISGNLIGNQETNIHLVRCRGIAITGNHIYSGKNRSIVLENSKHIVVGQNSLDQSHNEGRGFTNGVTVRDCDGVIISGLVLDNSAAGSEQEGGALEVFDSREVTISDCQIFEPHIRGIYATNSRNLRISGNTIVERTEQKRMLAAIEVKSPDGANVLSDNLTGEGKNGGVVADKGVAVVNHHAAK